MAPRLRTRKKAWPKRVLVCWSLYFYGVEGSVQASGPLVCRFGNVGLCLGLGLYTDWGFWVLGLCSSRLSNLSLQAWFDIGFGV